MQKLQEASDRKKGWRMRKEKGTSRKKEDAILFQQWLADDALASPSNNIKMDLSNYELKHWTWTNSQKRLTRC